MVELMILIGPSGAGKSTYAKKFQEQNPSYRIVSTDSIRKELFGSEDYQAYGDKVFALAYKRIRDYLQNNNDVIFDATNLTFKARKEVLKCTEGIEVFKSCRYFNTSFEVCNARQFLRERHVNETVIKKQFNKINFPTVDEGFNEIKVV